MNSLRKVFWMALVVSAVLLSGCAGDSGKIVEEPPAATGQGEEPGEKEPSEAQISFEGTDIAGNAVTSDIFTQSKLTMVNVWATYCAPCLSEMPGLGELASEYDAGQFQIIGIVSDVLTEEEQALVGDSDRDAGADRELVESLIQQTGADYTHLLLNSSVYYALLTDVTAVPTTFFIDENGTILDTVIGSRDKASWEELIDELLEGL